MRSRTLPLPAAALAALVTMLSSVAAARAADFNVFLGPNNNFSPSTLNIQVGDSVTWSNNGGVHNVRADDGSFRCANGCDGQSGNGTPSGAAWSVTRTFNSPGQVRYFCEVHGGPGGAGMSGVVNVAPGTGGGEPGTLRFSNASYNVNEGAGQAVITVLRLGGDDGAVSVSYATANGSATAGSDYSARSGTLNWADNDDDPKSFTVPIIDDGAVEGSETVNLSLSNPGGGATLGSPSSATLTIADNDGGGSPGTLSFTGTDFSAGEADGAASITVGRSGGSTGAVSVGYSTADGSAVSGEDYGAVSGSLAWGGGDSAVKSFQVPLVDDDTLEGDETVNLMLASPTGGAGLGAPSSATLTLLDDDFPSGPCVEDDHTVCLQGGRFLVRVDFTPPGGARQPGNAIPFTDRAGMFWFFNENNVEMLLKVLDACIEPFDRYWVFFAATTNVEFEVTVVDTVADRGRRYMNPQGMPALPVQDTNAFATCP